MPAKNSRIREEYLSRRHLLALSSAAGAAAFAGCFGGEEGNGDDLLPSEADAIDNDVPDGYEEDYHELVPGGAVNPYDDQYLFNPYGHQFNPGDAQELSYEYLAVYSTAESEFVPRIAENWEVDDDLHTTVEISDAYGWSDGTDVTAADFVTLLKLDVYMGMGLDQYVNGEDIQTDGDYAFTIQPKEEYQDLSEQLWLSQWIEVLLHVSEEQYGDFVDQFEAAESDDEMEAVQEDLVNFTPGWDETRYSGLFAFTEANEQFADQTPNQHHPVAQDWDFYLRHGEYEGEEGLRAEEVDWAHNESRTADDLPDRYDSPPVAYSGQTFSIIFGPNDEYISSDPAVRKALAYAVDFEAITEVTSPGTPVDEYSAGIDIGYVEEFVDADVLEAMPNYAQQDTERAAELLEDAGFERDDDDTWLTPDGDEWTIDFPVGDWFTDHSEMISNNLSEFGIDMDHFVQEMPTWQSEIQPDNDFDLSVHLDYGLARNYHAHADLESELFDNRHRAAVTERELFGEEVEVPPVGEPDSDETITVDIRESLDNLATAADDEEAMEYATEVAWVHNQLLPAAQVFPWSEFYWVDADEWDFDLESDDWLTSSRIAHYLLENGLSPR